MKWPAFFYPHRVSVRDLVEDGGRGESWADPRELRAEVKDEQKLVRDANGREVVSSTEVKVALDAAVPIGSLVTVWSGTTSQREARVIAVGRSDNTGSGLDSFLRLSLE
ncbi:hypothetical protein LJR045_000983 [Microbacterium sp. LjRoot45]|uniref:hypothetical protein n=1 Tax=Microbacterium sp. LjRoot45 TaxID=3342329 RepID=UPI003ECC9D83